MTTPKIHTQFDTETNQRLDQLFADWTFADNRADRADYNNSILNTEADTLAGYYAKAKREAIQAQADDQAAMLADLEATQNDASYRQV